MRERAVLIRDDSDRQRHDRHPEDITAPVTPEEVARAAVLLGVLIRDQLIEDLEDQLAAGTHLIQRDVEDEIVATDVTDEAFRGVSLHDVAQQTGEHADDAVALVVAVAVVELLEVVQVGVADGEQLTPADTIADVALDVDGAGQA